VVASSFGACLQPTAAIDKEANKSTLTKMANTFFIRQFLLSKILVCEHTTFTMRDNTPFFCLVKRYLNIYKQEN
jgi:hypothetical protein